MREELERLNYGRETDEVLSDGERRERLLSEFVDSVAESHPGVSNALLELRNDSKLTTYDCPKLLELEAEVTEGSGESAALRQDTGTTRYQVREAFQEHTAGWESPDRQALAEAVSGNLTAPYDRAVERLPEGITKFYMKLKGGEERRGETEMLTGPAEPVHSDIAHGSNHGIRSLAPPLEETLRRIEEGLPPNTYESLIEGRDPWMREQLEAAIQGGETFPLVMDTDEIAWNARTLHGAVTAMWDIEGHQSQWGVHQIMDMADLTAAAICAGTVQDIESTPEEAFTNHGTSKEEMLRQASDATERLSRSIQGSYWNGAESIERALLEAAVAGGTARLAAVGGNGVEE